MWYVISSNAYHNQMITRLLKDSKHEHISDLCCVSEIPHSNHKEEYNNKIRYNHSYSYYLLYLI